MGIRAAIGGLMALHSPVAPRNWGRYAQKLSAGIGWTPTMFLIAIVGAAGALQFGRNAQAQPPRWEFLLDYLATFTWILVGTMATILSTMHALRAMLRLGVWGTGRPRYWFEVARLNWNILIFAIGLLLLGVILGRHAPQALIQINVVLVDILRIGFALFIFASATGYALSWVKSRPRTGRAFQCVQYYFNIICPIVVMTMAAMQLPQPWNVANGWLPTTFLCLDVIWLLLGFLLIIKTYEKWEKRRSSAGVRF